VPPASLSAVGAASGEEVPNGCESARVEGAATAACPMVLPPGETGSALALEMFASPGCEDTAALRAQQVVLLVGTVGEVWVRQPSEADGGCGGLLSAGLRGLAAGGGAGQRADCQLRCNKTG